MKVELLKESGVKNIKDIAKKYQKAKIYFHQDLDGVTTAIAMREYLAKYGIRTVDCEITQYGSKEWAISAPDSEDIMAVLVDFAHGKPMFTIHTDHHDSQAGVEAGTSKNFRPARSNAETVSQVVSPNDLFPNEDILLISTVDSANFASQDISTDEVISYLWALDKDKSLQRNKMALGFVCNKLLLAFKSKPGFLEELVMKSKPSLLNILLNIKRIMSEKGYANVEKLEKHKDIYTRKMKNTPIVNVIGNIIVQYGGGDMYLPGSYDRYTPFKNNPEADFIVISWDMGLVQASCNPYKKNRALKGINLGEIKDMILLKWKSKLMEKPISLSTLKWVSENSRDFHSKSVGFTFKDFVAIYGENFKKMDNGREKLTIIGNIMTKPYYTLSEKQKVLLEKIQISAWDIIDKNSGGHKCITNISGLNYLGKDLQRPGDKDIVYVKDIDTQATIKFTKMIQDEFVRVLQEKIKSEK
jgi:hypothetical protein